MVAAAHIKIDSVMEVIKKAKHVADFTERTSGFNIPPLDARMLVRFVLETTMRARSDAQEVADIAGGNMVTAAQKAQDTLQEANAVLLRLAAVLEIPAPPPVALEERRRLDGPSSARQ